MLRVRGLPRGAPSLRILPVHRVWRVLRQGVECPSPAARSRRQVYGTCEPRFAPCPVTSALARSCAAVRGVAAKENAYDVLGQCYLPAAEADAPRAAARADEVREGDIDWVNSSTTPRRCAPSVRARAQPRSLKHYEKMVRAGHDLKASAITARVASRSLTSTQPSPRRRNRTSSPRRRGAGPSSCGGSSSAAFHHDGGALRSSRLPLS